MRISDWSSDVCSSDLLAATPGLTMLRSLFHEDTLRVFDAQPVNLACRCSRDGLGAMLLSLGEEEDEDHLKEHSRFDGTCAFFGRECIIIDDKERTTRQRVHQGKCDYENVKIKVHRITKNK